MYKRNINYAKSKHILTYFGCIAICIDLTVCLSMTLQAYMKGNTCIKIANKQQSMKRSTLV